jgi:hypothetical protein
MKQANHRGRWIAVVGAALTLLTVGTAAATTPPSEPPGDSTAGMGASDCPTIPATTEVSALGTAAAGPATSEAAAAGTQPTGTDAADNLVLAGRTVRGVRRDPRRQPVPRSVSVHAGRRRRADVCHDCAETWPPLIVEDRTGTFFPDYFDPELFTGVDHPEGEQVKFGDWPLYYFAQDTAPGDLNGQGVGGVWWLVAPTAH